MAFEHNMTMMTSNTSFQKFCGGQFWDTALTWEGPSPKFTLCFQWTALVWVPCAFLWLLLIPYVHYLKGLERSKHQRNMLNLLKTICGCILVFTTTCDLLKGAVDVSEGTKPAAYVVTPVILIATLLVSVLLIQYELKKGICTSGVLFMFHVFLIVAGIVPFYMKIIDPVEQGASHDLYRFITFYVYYGLLLVQFILLCFAEPVPQKSTVPGRKACPKMSASFLSRITQSWVFSLVYLGYKRHMEENDMFSPVPYYLTKAVSPDFEKEYNQQYMTKKKRRNTVEYNIESTENTPLIGQPDKAQASKTKKNISFKLFKVLVKVFGFTLLKGHLARLANDCLTFVTPLLQSGLITYTQDPSIPVWRGYLYAVLFLIVTLLNSILFNHMFYVGETVGIQIRAALTAAVYKKSLTLSNESRRKATVGEIVNLMSVDAQRVQACICYLFMIWSGPLQIIVSMYFLWNILGPSTLAGMALMIILIPVNVVIGSLNTRFQADQLKKKDVRIKVMNEVLSGIKILKLYAWELSFKEKVNKIRNLELKLIMKSAFIQAIASLTFNCAPFLVTLTCFAAFTLTGGVLDANKAFVSLTLFNILRMPLRFLPDFITQLIMAAVSIQRIARFLQLPDIEEDYVSHNPNADYPIAVTNGTFSWGDDRSSGNTLRNININVDDGSLVAVVGQVGCGKSSLISAVLGEMERLEGSVNVRGSVAYVAQEAWIQTKTVRENILFGRELDQKRYNEVLEACALKPDLEILPNGDLTEIGEKGINLSGGQKQRVSLARAVYRDADIYLLDDPLSAVDSKVGKHIYEKTIKGLLKNKTRIFVTHGVHWLPSVDQIIVMVGGSVAETGSYQQLLSYDGDFAQFLKTYLTNEEEDEEEEDEEVTAEKTRMRRQVSEVLLVNIESSMKSSDKASLRKRKSTILSGSKSQKTENKLIGEGGKTGKGGKGGGKVNLEKAEVGNIKFSTIYSYAKAVGLVVVFIWLLLLVLVQVATIMSSIWLSQWADDSVIINAALVNTPEYKKRTNLYLGVYGAYGAAQAICICGSSLLTALAAIRAARKLHENLLMNILKSPMSFFDITPIGRIMNRFSSDIAIVDTILPEKLRFWMTLFLATIFTFVVIGYSTPLFLAVIVPIFIVYYFVQDFYIKSTRQLKRIESVTRSPIFVHFGETVTGATTIRAFGDQKEFLEQSNYIVDRNLNFFYGGVIINRWLSFRLDIFAAAVVFSASIFAVLGKGSISGGIVGLSISYALQVTRNLGMLVRQFNEVQINIVSVERILEYSDTLNEDDWNKEESEPPSNWPYEGRVVMEGYSTRYRPELDMVLKDLTVDIRGNEKIGVVGRTGAGKSSMALSLFRLIEAAEGRIVIDGIPIGTLGLHQLRSRISILPQDPVLFSGTLRMNLDPFNQYTDEKIWSALENAHFKSFISELNEGLEFDCREGGQNLSVGQRQLVCLARILLRKTKLLVLDEATAAIDLETDDVIQKTIRTEFANCTVITIAHRINTIMDNDRVMVLDKGKIQEFDKPSVLMEDKSSLFYSMAKDAGLTNHSS